jgi:hypothetical protein
MLFLDYRYFYHHGEKWEAAIFASTPSGPVTAIRFTRKINFVMTFIKAHDVSSELFEKTLYGPSLSKAEELELILYDRMMFPIIKSFIEFHQAQI